MPCHQNWVGCTVRTPRTQVARTLRAQCPGRGRCCAHDRLVARMSCAQPAQVALSVRRSRNAQAVFPRPGCDIISKLRPPRQLSQVATSIPCRDLPSAQPKPPRSRPQKMGSRHQFQQARSRPQIDVAPILCSSHRNARVATRNLGRDTKPPQGSQNHVVTSNRCRDTTTSVSYCDAKTGHPHSQVATSFFGRDLKPCLARLQRPFLVATSSQPD